MYHIFSKLNLNKKVTKTINNNNDETFIRTRSKPTFFFGKKVGTGQALVITHTFTNKK